MPTLAQIMGIGGGGTLAPSVSRPFFESGTFIAPNDGVAELRGMGAGGGGAKANTGAATGGYSGAWGAKLVRVNKGDTITVVIGAGGAAGAANSNGSAGTATTFTVGGVTYTAPGGPGGVYASSGAPVVPNGPAIPANWDIGAASVKPGTIAGLTGGAGVDILAQGNNATSSASINTSGGGGTGGPGAGSNGGGAITGGKSISGLGPAATGIIEDASQREWIISFYGGSGGSGSSGPGGNGGGGAGTGAGGNGGGGGGGNGNGGAGGLGGGGGASGGGAGTAGPGGNGFAVIHFAADLGI